MYKYFYWSNFIDCLQKVLTPLNLSSCEQFKENDG